MYPNPHPARQTYAPSCVENHISPLKKIRNIPAMASPMMSPLSSRKTNDNSIAIRSPWEPVWDEETAKRMNRQNKLEIQRTREQQEALWQRISKYKNPIPIPGMYNSPTDAVYSNPPLPKHNLSLPSDKTFSIPSPTNKRR